MIMLGRGRLISAGTAHVDLRLEHMQWGAAKQYYSVYVYAAAA